MKVKSNSNKQTARLAGIFYLIVVICGGFSELYVRAGVMVPGDAKATAANIMASEGLFRIGFVSDIIMILAYFWMGRMLYALFEPVNKSMATHMVLVNMIGVPIMALNMLNHFAAILVLSNADYMNVFEADQLNAFALFFLQLHKYGYLIATISFGTWLFPIGYLVYTSGYFPKVLGVSLIVASAAFMIDFLTQFLFPMYAADVFAIVMAPAGIAEISFCLWLVIKGARNTPPVA